MSSSGAGDLRAQVIELADECLRGTADAEEMTRLEQLLQENPDARRIYLEFIEDTHGLRNWALAQTDQIEHVWPPDQPTPAAHEAGSPAGRRVLGTMLLAMAVVALVIVVAIRQGPEQGQNDVVRSDQPQDRPTEQDDSLQQQTPSQVVAMVEHAQDCVWSDGRQLVRGDELRASRRLQLKAGVAHLQFGNGATVTLEGPSDLELLSESATQLHTGTLSSTVPATAVGFQVRTPTLNVIDLGTRFGVFVAADGETHVSVFDGRVSVALTRSSRATDHEDSEQHVLQQGASIRAVPPAGAIEPIEFLHEPFRRTARVSTGIERLQGDCRFAMQPVVAGVLPHDDRRILIGLEKRGVVIPRDLPVSFRPGDAPVEPGSKPDPLTAGTSVDCFLVQFRPAPSAIPRQGVTAVARVTFDRPVVGVIASGPLLKRSDRLFSGQASAIPPRQRGGESPAPDRPREQDELVVSDDHRTIEVTARVLKHMDQMRVLIRSADTDSDPADESTDASDQ